MEGQPRDLAVQIEQFYNNNQNLPVNVADVWERMDLGFFQSVLDAPKEPSCQPSEQH